MLKRTCASVCLCKCSLHICRRQNCCVCASWSVTQRNYNQRSTGKNHQAQNSSLAHREWARSMLCYKRRVRAFIIRARVRESEDFKYQRRREQSKQMVHFCKMRTRNAHREFGPGRKMSRGHRHHGVRERTGAFSLSVSPSAHNTRPLTVGAGRMMQQRIFIFHKHRWEFVPIKLQ